jgi:single-strand DNA-binding protein
MATNVNRSEQALRASFATVGNLGNDPEPRYTATGTLVVTASIAVHSSYKQGEEWKERTDWFRLVAFGEALGRFGKGERVRVLGRLRSSEYSDREGQRRTSVELVVLRSDPAPLPRKGDDPAAAPEPPAEEPIAEPTAEVASADAAAPKPCQRKKVAA